MAPSSLCLICTKIIWFRLQPEDVEATPHHKNRRNLENSAKSCPMCRLVLRAAISEYRDSRGRRHGKGHWKAFLSIIYPGPNGAQSTYQAGTSFGSFCPAARSTWGNGTSVIAATGMFNAELEHVAEYNERDLTLGMDSLTLDNNIGDMPVWVYGNYWAREWPGSQGAGERKLVLMGIGARFATSKSILDTVDLPKDQLRISGSPIGITTDDDDQNARMIPGRLREMNSGSDKAFVRIQRWLRHCNGNHARCKPQVAQVTLPTRVLDVFHRTMFGSEKKVSVVETAKIKGKYIALSHCWGTSSRLMATKASFPGLKKGIDISALPKTFQEAIQITRRLGVQYLWIDCLCIIQDDPQDWEREAATMATVYRDAYLTISASASSDSYTGCFPQRTTDSYISPGTASLGYTTPREASGPNHAEASYQLSSGGGKRMKVHMFEEWLPGSVFNAAQKTPIGTFGRRYDPIANQPLSTRGWTLQERLLSPRTIHYASDQTYYECETEVRSEDGFQFPDMTFNMATLITTQRIPWAQHGLLKGGGMSFIAGQDAGGKGSTGIRWKGGWLSVIEDFSRRRLTKGTDKLPAMAGVARVLAQETGDTYLAGLWMQHIHEDLCWRVYAQEENFDRDESGIAKRPVLGQIIGPVSRPVEYRAPSWSWASLDAPVKYIPLSYANLVSHVTKVEVVPQGQDIYSKVSSGNLEISGPVYEIEPYQPKKPWERHGMPVKLKLNDQRGPCLGAVHLDIPGYPLPSPCYALFLDSAKAIILVGFSFDSNSAVGSRPDSSPLLTSDFIAESAKTNPDLLRGTLVATNGGLRIGMGDFVKNFNTQGIMDDDIPPKPVEQYNPEVHGGPNNIMSVSGDQSWGPVTNNDPKIGVKIL